jgi:hypothetical protein
MKHTLPPLGNAANAANAATAQSTPSLHPASGERGGRQAFRSGGYQEALTHHYGKLLHMSRTLVGAPNERETVMLEKIRKLEAELEDEKQLASNDWDPIRARIEGARSASQRDRDIQINIYGLETSMQSVATMDSAFSAMMKAAAAEVEDVERSFKNRVSIGAPNFGKNRRRMSKEKQRNRAAAKDTSEAGLAQRQMKRLTGGTQLPHVHIKQLPATKNATWGFPVFYTPGDYGPDAAQKRERAQRAEQLRTQSNNLRMKEEEEEQKAVARLIESEEREADYEKFVLLADRFGALDGELFCMSRRPGRLYEHLAYASATLLQIWWKIVWPHRRVVKVEAAIMLQRVYRGKMGRERYRVLRRYEDNVGVMLRRIMNRAIHLTFSKWHDYVQQRAGAKRLIRRIMNRLSADMFEMWHANAREEIEERNAKLRVAMARFVNKRLYQSLRVWEEMYRSAKRVKNMMRRHLRGMKQHVFEEWRDNARDKKDHRHQNEAASFLQRVWRGHRGYVDFQRTYVKTTAACVQIGRIVRGHLGRRRVDMMKRTEQRRIRREARMMRREARRAELEDRWCRERERLADEERVLRQVEIDTAKEGGSPRAQGENHADQAALRRRAPRHAQDADERGDEDCAAAAREGGRRTPARVGPRGLSQGASGHHRAGGDYR